MTTPQTASSDWECAMEHPQSDEAGNAGEVLA